MERIEFEDFEAWSQRVESQGLIRVSQGRGSYLAYRDLRDFHVGAWTNNADLSINQHPNGWLYQIN